MHGDMWSELVRLEIHISSHLVDKQEMQEYYRMAKKVERDCWDNLVISNGILLAGERPKYSFNLTKFHRKSIESDSYSY